MHKIIAISLLAAACTQGQSKLDAPEKACKPEDNKAQKLTVSEDKDAKCEQYYCDVGQTHYYAVKCEMSDRRRVWTSVDTLNGPQIRWLNAPAEVPAPEAPKDPGPPVPPAKKK